jgi:hypothetical protein
MILQRGKGAMALVGYPHLLSRIIFLTGDVLSPEAQAFFNQVSCPRIVKPFQAREVRRLIQQVLEAQ